jgi:glycosyltransferase 2 family protein
VRCSNYPNEYFPSKEIGSGRKMRKVLIILISTGIVAGVFFFFYREFAKNVGSLALAEIVIRPGGIISSFVVTIAAYLLLTFAWRYSLLALSPGKKFGFSDSISAVNLSALTKYLPGKIWSYAIQIYWLSSFGFAKSVVVYTNLLNVFVSLLVCAILGAVFFLVEPGFIGKELAMALTIFLIIIDVAFVVMNARVIKWGITIVNRIFRKDITFIETPRSLLVNLQLLFVGIYCLFGLGAYFLCGGIGIPLSSGHLYSIISGIAVADSIGFLAFVVPGGLGVREGVLYFVLKEVTNDRVALLLPIATRIVMMAAEATLGLLALYLLRKRRLIGYRDTFSRHNETIEP